MNQGCKKKWKQRIYSYIYEMKKGQEGSISARIVSDIEIYVFGLSVQIADLEKNILNQEKTILELKRELRNK